ncbi:hypothetical protein E8E13_000282 [Curvularia kusanoi]|uniref:Heterokaryon incompatibility domain-containing protein n=1 Tax=Curvularia kusanoi TaxID=90978 RepID=A0A9P4W543_CURKU|nr:hypothetical protein E8E13_000282 [Curvularia kusanoi]
MDVGHIESGTVVPDFEEMSPDSRAANDQDINVCQRCSVLCQDPAVWTLPWNFVFKFDAKGNGLDGLRCKICQFLEEVTAEHQRRSAERLPPPSLSISRTYYAQGKNYLRIAYEISTTHQTYYVVPLSHLGSTDYQPSLSPQVQRIAYDEVRKWIVQCQDHDKFNLGLGEVTRNLKVISCESDNATVVDAPQSCDYVALSYVWGGTKEASFTTGDVLGDDLPQTIQDSIKVTRELGFKYLWVDRYVS